jgi:pyrrolidone-carboxylate peptidase
MNEVTRARLVRHPLIAGIGLLSLLLAGQADAQRGPAPHRNARRLPTPQSNLSPPGLGQGSPRQQQMALGARPVILLTGYWPPTNEMVRQFSPTLNPGGWQGSNWEGRGYDIYGYFPEFSNPNCTNCGQGSGDLEVDYQDTTQDFWAIANSLQPIAILTTSRGSFGNKWEVEMNQRNKSTWIADFTAPTQPTPAPPDGSVPAETIRLSTLPVQAIVDSVAASGLPVDPEICWTGFGGGFLSEFVAYNGVWYQDLHKNPEDPAWCVAAGHIHVGTQVDWPTSTAATEVSLRAMIEYVDRTLECSAVSRYCVGAPNSSGPGASIGWYGSTDIPTNDFHLTVQGATKNNFGLFFYGTAATQIHLGNGFLCVTGATARIYPAMSLDATGSAERWLDFTQPPASSGSLPIGPGDSYRFQFWYRDPQLGTPGFNFSDALKVEFCL